MVRYAVLKGLYDLEKTIGCGGFAKVKLATHCLTREKVAVKIMEKACLGADLPRVKLELQALQTLSHHHICKLYQIIETDTHFFMVVEYCSGGELFDHIVERNRLGEMHARSFFRQIVSAVAYLHEHGYAHRDLKPENVLLDKDQNLKLIDFGLCAKPTGGLESHLYTSCGSPTYAAPELILGKKYLGSEVDIWSMGVLLYALLCGFLPFDDDNIESLYKKILSGRYDEPIWLSAESKRLIRCMLQVDPKRRITIDKLLCHPWLLVGYGDPVSKESLFEMHERDDHCVKVMAQYYGKSVEEMWSQLSSWNYDYDTATYFLLLARRKRGLPVRLARLPLKTKVVVEMLSNDENNAESSPKRPDISNYVALRGKEMTQDDEENLGVTPLNGVDWNKNISAEKENKQEGFLEPVPPMPHRKPHKRYWSPGLDEPPSPVPAKMTPGRGRLTDTPGSSDGNGSTTGCMSPLPGSPRCARKVLDSLERSLSRVRNVLTPKRRNQRAATSTGPPQPVIVPAKDVCNVSTTHSSNPEHVLEQLRHALISKGIDCRQKGFVLRAKHPRLSFELEVCLVAAGNSAPVVGVRRKRLKGDAWCYKRVCEEVLALASVKPLTTAL
ncbi:maternal embryonic leucine zipper kinase [Anabrus simplex]|uniref:maternal embryonic leucine zipper kinase n=1 Tax=Anabrus simplex TaxID=316456 RepID=UPI0035A34972